MQKRITDSQYTSQKEHVLRIDKHQNICNKVLYYKRKGSTLAPFLVIVTDIIL